MTFSLQAAVDASKFAANDAARIAARDAAKAAAAAAVAAADAHRGIRTIELARVDGKLGIVLAEYKHVRMPNQYQLGVDKLDP